MRAPGTKGEVVDVSRFRPGGGCALCLVGTASVDVVRVCSCFTLWYGFAGLDMYKYVAERGPVTGERTRVVLDRL